MKKALYSLTILTFISGLLATFAVYQIESRYSLHHAKMHTQGHTFPHIARIESLIGTAVFAAQGLAAEIRYQPVLNIEHINYVIDTLIANESQIRHVALAKDLVIHYVRPLEGNASAIGLDYRNVPAQYAEVQEALDAKGPILSGPVDLVQGGRALIVRNPVYLDSEKTQLWGIIAVVLNFEEVLYAAELMELERDERVGIRRLSATGEVEQAVYGDQQVFNDSPVIIPVRLPSGAWQVGVVPKAGWRVGTDVAARIFVVGTLLTILACLVVFLLLRNRQNRRAHLDEMRRHATHDYLTGLPNRLQLSALLKRKTYLSAGEEEPFCVIFIDIDNFKDINDSLGHNLGDELLVGAAQRLQSGLRPSDFLARLGGDEFVVVLSGMGDPAQAELWAKKLIHELSNSFSVGRYELKITVSLGLAFFPQDGLDAVSLLQHADRAMYAAKETGKNTFHFFNLSLRAQADRHVQLYHDMIVALEDRQFDVFYQPIMDLRTGEFSRCEALLRWKHPDNGWISPMDFIPVAEKSGFIRPLGLWVLHRVCQDMVKLRERGIFVHVSVNRSTNEFCDDATLRQWMPIVRSYQLEPEDFTLEITESLLMNDDKTQVEKINRIKAEGFKLAIDDFGTGYSGINYLRQYPVDIVKIDKSFIAGLLDSEQDRTLLYVLLKMAKTLGLELVIEGIEKQAQLDLVTDKQCEFAQGFLLAKPMPFSEYCDFVEQQTAIDVVEK